MAARHALPLLCLLTAALPFAAPAGGHPIHDDYCNPNMGAPGPFGLWLGAYLDQLIGNNPEDPIEGDIFSGIIWVNSCWTIYYDASPHNTCDPTDVRTSEQMLLDWKDAHPGEVVIDAVPPLNHEVRACWD